MFADNGRSGKAMLATRLPRKFAPASLRLVTTASASCVPLHRWKRNDDRTTAIAMGPALEPKSREHHRDRIPLGRNNDARAHHQPVIRRLPPDHRGSAGHRRDDSARDAAHAKDPSAGAVGQGPAGRSSLPPGHNCARRSPGQDRGLTRQARFAPTASNCLSRAFTASAKCVSTTGALAKRTPNGFTGEPFRSTS